MLKKIKQRLIVLLFVVGISFGIFVNSAVAVSVTWSANTVSGDNVQIQAAGDPNATVQLYFFPAGATSAAVASLGTTDSSGNFSKTISSGALGVPSGVQSRVVINGQLSSLVAWPTYTSSLTLNQANIHMTIGQNLFVLPSGPASVSFNSNTAVVSAAASGGQILFIGASIGAASVTICGANVGCNTLNVSVEGQISAYLSFSKNSFTINSNQSVDVNVVYTGSSDGFLITANSNPDAVEANISGQSNIITLFGKTTAGSATITVCPKSASYSCGNLYIMNVVTVNSGLVTLSKDSIALANGQSTTVMANGDPHNSYFVSSNPNSGVVSAYVSGSTITLTGGSVVGATTIVICSTAVTNACANIAVSTNISNASASVAAISFAQNSVNLNLGQTASVAIYGNSSGSYVWDYNTNPSVVFANVINGNTLKLVAGSTGGSSIINICKADGSACGKFYVSVGTTGVGSSSAISFEQSNIFLSPGQSQSVAITGGSNTGYVWDSNTNPDIAFARVNGNAVFVTAVGVNGTTYIKICSATVSNSCGTMVVTVSAATISSSAITVSQNNIILNQAQTVTVLLTGGSGKYRVYYNSSPGIVATNINGKNLALNGGDSSGQATVTICSTVDNINCVNVNVTVSSYISPLSFSQKNITLNKGSSTGVTVFYGSATGGFTVSFNSNPDVVIAGVPNSGRVVTLTGGSTSGTAVVSVCSSVLTYDCSNIYVTNNAAQVAVPVVTPLPVIIPSVVTPVAVSVFNRDLKYGMANTDVKKLQKYLNNNGFTVAVKGSGSPGKEVTNFGSLTKKALIKFQKAKKITPANGIFSGATRKYVNSHP